MKYTLFTLSIFSVLIGIGCIGDDIVFDTVDPVIRIDNAVDTIAIDSQYQFQFSFLNNIGMKEEISNAIWSSSDPGIIEISNDGLATAIETGSATIRVEANLDDGTTVKDEHTVAVGKRTVIETQSRTGTIRTTSSYTLEGSFELSEKNDGLVLSIGNDYKASTSLPGLYIYLTNNPNTTNGALELSKVTVFQGAHSYEIPADVELNEYKYVLYYCKPFNVKVGDGEFDN